MVEKFTYGSKEGVKKLNQIVDNINFLNPNGSVPSTGMTHQKQYTIAEGVIKENPSGGSFVGNFLDGNGDEAVSGDYFEQEITYTGSDTSLVNETFIAIKMPSDGSWHCINLSGGGSTSTTDNPSNVEGGTYRAVLQEGLQTDGKVSVQITDSEGGGEGAEYDVFIFPDQRTGITVANYKWALTNELPAEGDIIIISSDQDGYFYIISALVLMEEC